MAFVDNTRIVELQVTHGLTYHVPYAFNAEQLVGLSGKKILEVGGSLPRPLVFDDLHVKQWIAIEEPSYWHELQEGGGTPPAEPMSRLLRNVTNYSDLPDYAVLAGGIEELPSTLEGRFDLVFSIAAFEHILMLPLALERMYAALRPGGRLISMFSPIWSAHDGHHLPDISDKSGKSFSFHQSPIPPWGHLLMRPPQLFKYLLSHTDIGTATRIVYYTYHSPHINRLFSEDYSSYIQASPFYVEKLIRTFQVAVPEHIQKALVSLHPGRLHFSNNGLIAILLKPD